MNILCLVSYNFLPAKMGGQKGIASFYEFYAKELNITCVTTKSNDPKEANYEVLNILSNSAFRYINIRYFFTLRKMIRSKNISHVQIEHPYYGWLAILLKWFCRVPLIVHSHNIESLRFKSIGKKWWRLLWMYEKWVHRNADFNLFISEEDKVFAQNNYGLSNDKCITATYGIDWQEAPSDEEKKQCKGSLTHQYRIGSESLILLYNGTFSYKPNLDGLYTILDSINPILIQEGLQYAIVICGKNIPEELKSQQYPNVFIEGFVPDISIYFKGADIFLNPVMDGGGIKTKLVEALGYNLFAISYEDGAIGIPKDCAEDKLSIVANPQEFAQKIIDLKHRKSSIPPKYFEHFYWGNIIRRVVNFLQRKQ